MEKCDMCHKGVIRVTMKGEEIKCRWCAGTGELEAKGKYRLNEAITD